MIAVVVIAAAVGGGVGGAIGSQGGEKKAKCGQWSKVCVGVSRSTPELNYRWGLLHVSV